MPAKLTKEDFIARATTRHNGKYDYRLVNYINGKTKVDIICPIHGVFSQSPEKHMKGQQCKECAKEENASRCRMPREEFVRRASNRFKGKFDYSLVEYINNTTLVKIVCPVHGVFEQLPSVHLTAKHGCPQCRNEIEGIRQRKTTSQFITEAISVHGSRYLYDKVEYTTNDTPVTITCPEHGDFEQTPVSHLSGSGCPKCIGRNRTTEDFIIEANKIHKCKYDYTLTEYTKADAKVIILCPEHGVFKQRACEHLKGKGCPKCKGFNKTTDEFISQARSVHGDLYDYSKTTYQNSTHPVIIVCSKHGEFKQKPSDHLKGKGCRKCGFERSANSCRMKPDEFIERAGLLHNYKYDYSNVRYVNGRTLVDILCLKHNSYFQQQPELHLRGCGCPTCAQEVRNASLSHDKKWFVRESTIQHGEKFDYSNVIYKNFSTEVEISCPIHGAFFQLPYVHINSKFGCPKCASEYLGSIHRMSEQEFLQRVTKIHGDSIGFDRVHYINSTTPVEVLCAEHGYFEKTPNALLQGQGCPRCSGSLITNEDFIERAKSLHGNKYDYSITHYRDMHSIIRYVCPEHGVIEQMAQSHLKGGCKYCAGNVAFSKEDFLQRANSKFGNKYDYSRMNYVDFRHTNIEIRCPIHGFFSIKPSDFISSKLGCPKCGRMNGYLPRMVKREEFVQRCNDIFGCKYDYSHVPEDMALNDTLEIICPEHGSFYLTGTVHLHNKCGCSKCAGHNKTEQDVLEIFREVHGERYIYPHFTFNKLTDKIDIVCRKHGKFSQSIAAHSKGAGCPRCCSSRMETKVIRALAKRGIDFIDQKRFPWLVYKGKQSLDLYLPDYNLAIECQGKQHFMEIEIMGGREAFEQRYDMDRNKYELCKSHGIRILYYCTKSEYLPKDYFDVIYYTIGELIDEIINSG